ncbi:MAG TPA: undecaprenyldiphospho-muramoylpentapeptide beta-N-acetylglucosaminyltransferase [Acidimicrobiales bacterium]|nr:undecaprenyldiphospho-muramoylpentapeptide beta-N-acetylglucosaminyltransferase [Acidimicrobiales bacterium]
MTLPERAVAIVTGGGTAGHVLPALAVADALVDAGHDREAIVYAGSERGIETRLVPPSGFPLVLLPGRGIQRRLTLANVAAVWGLLRAAVQAVALVRRLRPRVVVAVGGYASVAVGLAAVLWRVPLVVAEQNAAPGAANRLLARFARASAVSFEGTPLPRAVVTGNPVRPEIRAIDPERDRARARAALGVGEGRRLVLVFGGSLGALRINQAVVDALPAWRDRSDLAVHHVVGDRDWEVIGAAAPSDLGVLQYRAVRYEDDMPTALAAADLAVCRAGSGTCFELAAVGLPAVLVPSPHVTADQQTANARRLVHAGAARLVPDAELDGARLIAEVDTLLADDAARAEMAAAARRWARPDAAERIAALALEHARA